MASSSSEDDHDNGDGDDDGEGDDMINMMLIRDAILSKKCSFLNIVQKAFDPTPLLFEHLSYFAGGVF